LVTGLVNGGIHLWDTNTFSLLRTLAVGSPTGAIGEFAGLGSGVANYVEKLKFSKRNLAFASTVQYKASLDLWTLA